MMREKTCNGWVSDSCRRY